MAGSLTPGALKAVALAREEARALDHAWLGSEHLLVGIAGVKTGGAAIVFGRVHVDDFSLRAPLVELVPRAPRSPGNVYLPLTQPARWAFEKAARAARDLGRFQVGTEHLLFGLLEDPEGLATAILEKAGVEPRKVRGELLDVLRSHVPDSREPAPVPKPRPTEPPLFACPRGHGPMDKLQHDEVMIAVCQECLGTFVPAGQLARLVYLKERGLLDTGALNVPFERTES